MQRCSIQKVESIPHHNFKWAPYYSNGVSNASLSIHGWKRSWTHISRVTVKWSNSGKLDKADAGQYCGELSSYKGLYKVWSYEAVLNTSAEWRPAEKMKDTYLHCKTYYSLDMSKSANQTFMFSKSNYWKLSSHSNENWKNFSESESQAPHLQKQLELQYQRSVALRPHLFQECLHLIF